jgi:hypothetical protein
MLGNDGISHNVGTQSGIGQPTGGAFVINPTWQSQHARQPAWPPSDSGRENGVGQSARAA